MTCYSPLKGFYSKDVNASGKRGLVFNHNAALSPIPVYVGCGQCIGCRLDRAAQWAIRCTHEAQLHDEKSFLTLTYDDDNLPLGGSLVVRDLQLFLKRLHNRLLRERGYGIRYYACGEYGDTTFRPHYHAIIFGYSFPDKTLFKRNGRGESVFTSNYLRELWKFGHNTVGDVSFDSAAYVAGYCVKKINGDDAEAHYTRYAEDGSSYKVVPEFPLMSRRPGIGYDWFLKYGRHAYKFDSVIMNGREVSPPRFYDDKLAQVDMQEFERLKSARRRVTKTRRLENMVDRLIVREKVAKAKFNLRSRDVT